MSDDISTVGCPGPPPAVPWPATANSDRRDRKERNISTRDCLYFPIKLNLDDWEIVVHFFHLRAFLPLLPFLAFLVLLSFLVLLPLRLLLPLRDLRA